jgi:hypothetical protein
MPLRVISYDGASYKQEFLDKSNTKRYPVATLVLYFGTDSKWTAPKSLYECFDVPKELKPFVSDYKINVFDIAWLDDETISLFKSDFRFVAKYFQTKRLNKDYIPTSGELLHADSLMKMFTALTGDKSFETAYNKVILEKKGGITMCDVVERIEDRGKAEVIRKMLDAKLVTEQQIADLLKISVKEVKKIAAKVPVEA